MHDTDAGPVDEREVPPALAAALEDAFGLERRPTTLGEWVDATETRLGEVGLTVTYAELCTTADGPHVAHFDGRTQAFICVLDTFLLPYAADVSGPIGVESRSPAGDGVGFTVTREEIRTDPAGAVISFGVADDVPAPDPDEMSPVLAYERLCPYVHAFPSLAAYDAWADSLEGAVTMALPADAGFELAGLVAGGEQFFPGSDAA